MTARLTGAQARRIALAAQGFGRPRPPAASMRHLQGVIDRLGQFQIDSVTVVQRAHYLPAFSRLGAYDRSLLDRAQERSPRRLFEYWGHAASLVDVTLEPALRWRMRVRGERTGGRLDDVLARHPALPDRVLAQLAASGPLRAADVEHAEGPRRRDHWGWNWSEAKHVLEWLFDSGQVLVAGRTASFERLYDLRERVLPPDVLAAETPDDEEAMRLLTGRALAALGVGSTAAVADYFRLRVDATRRALQHLQRAGLAEPVHVEGSPDAWLWSAAARPRRIRGQSLISPFDSLVYERRRLEELFGVRYRLEIYTPAHRRVHGYYVYLFRLDEDLAARVDLRADRATGVLQVRSAWLEPGAVADAVAPRLRDELWLAARWLGLSDVLVTDAGTLAGPLRRAAAVSGAG